jgi:cystathionine gamma-synthase
MERPSAAVGCAAASQECMLRVSDRIWSSWFVIDLGFSFPYTDTLKILQKWSPGCHFLGHGLDCSIDELETILKTSSRLLDSAHSPILALFTEFPSNPLLRSANLPRLRALADEWGFLIVIDETVGNFYNVQVLPYADIVVSSLTKVFSGDSNVMGGRCMSCV